MVYQRCLKKMISFSGCYGENLSRFRSHRLSNWSTGELIDAKNPKPKNGFLSLRLCKLSQLVLWVLLENWSTPFGGGSCKPVFKFNRPTLRTRLNQLTLISSSVSTVPFKRSQLSAALMMWVQISSAPLGGRKKILAVPSDKATNWIKRRLWI